jgi:hypothetical protein
VQFSYDFLYIHETVRNAMFFMKVVWLEEIKLSSSAPVHLPWMAS